MRITQIRIKKKGKENTRMRAFVTVTFDDEFAVHSIRLLDGNTGFFIAMPSRPVADGKFVDTAHPIKQSFRDMLKDFIVEAYDKSGDDENREYIFNADADGNLEEVEVEEIEEE